VSYLLVRPLISACILARNEEHQIEAALQSLTDWTDQLIVIDNESDDGTVTVARRYTDHILTAPRAANFDAVRNLAIDAAIGDWIFYLDADERVPSRLGAALRQLIQERGQEFEALCIPFKHYFCGKWMEHSGWWPGYTRPQLLKKGRFRYNERLHSGVEVDGRTQFFPAEDPDLAITHYSYDNLHHYLEKLNRYTDGEAKGSLWEDGASHSWQAQLAHFVHDWQVYYEHGRADLDGMHGFVLAFMSGFYRFLSRAKLWDLRRRRGELGVPEPVPTTLREMLEFMGRVAQEGAEPWLTASYPRNSVIGETVPPEWYAPAETTSAEAEVVGSEDPVRITACVMAGNEEQHFEGALQSLKGWTDQIIVVNNGSEEGTIAVAQRAADLVLSAPGAPRGDAVWNLAIEQATGDWIFFLDAHERVPPCLGPVLRRLVREHGAEFEALCLPCKNYLYGRWMQSRAWWPGYRRPQLLKKGAFQYNPSTPAGIEVDGRKRHLSADDPDLAIVHYAYDDLHHYLAKLNGDTEAEAEEHAALGQSHSWQAQLAHFVQEWQVHYEHGQAALDGMHGFVQSFLCAFYQFATRAKIWDRRRRRDELPENEPVPANLREMLQFMAQVAQGDIAPRSAVRPSPVHAARERVPLFWRAPLLGPSGYADGARQLVLGLIAAGEPIALAPESWGDDDAGLPSEVQCLIQEHSVSPNTPAEFGVFYTLLGLQQPLPNVDFSIARTMFETDRLPAGAAERLNRMDRIWVPSTFNRETFVRSGVDPQKIAVVPEALDPAPFAAPELTPWPIPGSERYRFLSVFDWTLHKGWDVLLTAFATEFGADPHVGLILKVWSSYGYTLEEIQRQADGLLQEKLGRLLSDFPNIHLWRENIPAGELPRLYRAVDAFVLPTRGEGWCRPLMEAMATGLPTIATAWSGPTAFHNERVGYPLEYQLLPVSAAGAREIPIYAGHCWAEPDQSDLRRLMRQLINEPEAACEKGQTAQKSIAGQYSREAVTARLQEELAHCRALVKERPPAAAPTLVSAPSPNGRQQPVPISPSANSDRRQRPVPIKSPANPIHRAPANPVDFAAILGRPLRVRWEGPQSILSSLALVNRELCLGLLGSGDVELSVVERINPWHTLTEEHDPRFGPLFARREAALSGPSDITIRHHFPPRWERPETGKLVVMQPWEWSHLPERAWIEGATRHADEVWAYSRFVRDVYVRSGVPAEKVRVVPLGFNPQVFTPEGPRWALPTRKSIRFLFVGGALERKGADLLLEAYRRAFTPQDDVCLVVKDMGTRTFYQGQTFGEAFRQAAADPSGPEVVYLDQDLSDAELASLYRACTCVVLPYRGEGFALAPLEGMACGLPAIVTSGGPTDDYLDDMLALRVPHYRVPRKGPSQGMLPYAAEPWELVPDLDALIAALRWVRDHPAERLKRGEAALAHVQTHWSWESAVGEVRERLLTIVAPPNERPLVPAQGWSEPCVSESDHEPVRALGQVELSLCMIVRDEEPRIAECLKSIAPYVDEMVVVDTGSTDRTREIARECGARVFNFAWTDSFAEARNQSLEQARGDWIFWMDADDVISPQVGQELRSLIRRHPQRDVAYQIQVRIPPGPKEFSVSVVDHVKLFPNRPDLRFEHRIHEQILPSLRRAGLEVRFSELSVTHQNYDRSDAGQEKKRQRDFRLLELDLRDRPNHPFVLFNLGMTHLYATKEYEVAAHYLRRSLDESDWTDSIVRKAYAMITTARICQQDWGAAIAANEEGRSYYSDDAELLFQAGQIYQHVGRFSEARKALERLMDGREEPHYRSVDTGLRTYRGQHELALLFRLLGDLPHAEQVLRDIAAAFPDYIPAQLDLAETLCMLGQLPEARSVLSRIPAAEGIEEQLKHLYQLSGSLPEASTRAWERTGAR
jgi:glycosyltransferase involved in cell wall biosynthesis